MWYHAQNIINQKYKPQVHTTGSNKQDSQLEQVSIMEF